ncbi:hypothetical protein V5799_009913 [Amblyomma americanum]|uniref:Secreted protein n=1 Tax=Amblyomma americanum TaxID=6943 RepID=A0AAQ4FAH0_AMBAM
MSLTNPFLFFIQAMLFTCSSPSTAEARCSLSATADKDYRMVKPTIPQRYDINDMFLSMRTWASPPAGLSLQSSVTSPPWQCKRATTSRIPASGRGGGMATMSLTNPFLFFIQAMLFTCSSPSTAEARCSLSATADKDYRMVKPTIPQRYDINDMFLSMRTWASPPAGLSLQSSVTSPPWQCKKATTSRIPASGRGGGMATMSLTNPFLFFIQAMLFTCSSPSTAEARCSLSAKADKDYRMVKPTIPQRYDINDMFLSMRTWASPPAGLSLQSSVTSPPWQCKRATTSRIPASGRGGGMATMSLTNPFLFFIQAMLFTCSSPSTAEARCSLSAKADKDYRMVKPTIPQRYDINDMFLSMRTWASPPAGLSLQSSVTSPPWQCKRASTSRIPASGRGGGMATMSLTNPFLFFIQAMLFTCSSPSTAEARCSLSATADKDYRMVKPTIPQRYDINDMFLSMRTWASPPAGLSLQSSVTSPPWQCKRATTSRIPASGRGGGMATMSLTNPFLFFIQAMLFTCSSRSTAEARCSLSATADKDYRMVKPTIPQRYDINDMFLSMRTWASPPAGLSLQSSVTSPPWQCKRATTSRIPASGRGGGMATMSLTNPFLFFIQAMLFTCSSPSTAEAPCSLSATADKDYRMVKPTIPQRYDINDMFLSMRTWASPPAGLSLQSSVTSPPWQCKRATTSRIPASGRGGGMATMSLTNPFLFFIQAMLFTCSSPSTAEARCSLSATADKDYRMVKPTIPQRYDINDMFLSMRTWASPPAGLSLQSSVTSPPWQCKRATTSRIPASGRGGGMATMSLTNPFLFFIQAMLFTCSSPSTAEARCSLSATADKDYRMVKPTIPQRYDINDMFLSMRTWASPPAGLSLQSSVTSPPWQCKSATTSRIPASGRGGGMATMSLTNPFLFFIQAMLFTCSSPSTAEARCSLSATADKDYRMVKPTIPQRYDINDMFLSMRTWASPPAGLSLQSSVTSPPWQCKRATTSRIPASGRGGGMATMSLTNPFLFFIQAMLFTCSSPSTAEARCSLSATADKDYRMVKPTIPQ